MTQMMIEEGKQHIPIYGVKLSGKAREVASKEYSKAIKEGLQARNKAGYGAGNLYQRQFGATNNNKNSENNSDQTNKYNPNEYEVPEGYIMLYKDGEPYVFPPDQVKKKLTQGYSYE